MLKTITDEQREALLHKSLVDSFNGYDFRDTIQKAVSTRAAELAVEMLKRDEYGKLIEDAVYAGVQDFLKRLRAGIYSAMLQMLCGKERAGSYHDAEPGILLQHVQRVKLGGEG